MSNIFTIDYQGTGSPGKLYMNHQLGFHSHRGGWGAAMNKLNVLHNEHSHVKFVGFVDLIFGNSMYQSQLVDEIPKSSWVGVLHNPPNLPEWYNYNMSLKGVTTSELFYEKLNMCKGLYTTTNNMKEWLDIRLQHHGVKTNVLYHPHVCENYLQFDMESYNNNTMKMLVDVGTWCRRVSSIYIGNFPQQFKLVNLWPAGYSTISSKRSSIQNMLGKELDIIGHDSNLNHVYQQDYLQQHEYDSLLSRNIMFFDYWDTSANNIIMECIERGTPLVCRRGVSVIEYLGADYPLFFDDLCDCDDIITTDNIQLAHEHLLNIKKSKRFDLDNFVDNIVESDIYKSI